MANCDLSVYGPNGFFRGFKGSVSNLPNAQLDLHAYYTDDDDGIELRIANPSSDTANVTIRDQYTGKKIALEIEAGRSKSIFFSLERFSGWYDFLITVASDSSVEYHFAGHVETGEDSISDPLFGGPLKHDDNDDEGDNRGNNRGNDGE